MVCDTNLSADGFLEKSLYAAKLTYAAKAMQRNIHSAAQRDIYLRPELLMHFMKRRINDDYRENNHRHRGNPSHPVESLGINFIPHKIPPIHQNQQEDQYDRKQKPV